MLLNELMEEKERFSHNERIIIEFIKKLNININSYSARQIAKETYTSPSTVVRLCKKLNCESFREFKEKYIEELRYMNRKENIDNSIPFVEINTNYEIMNNMVTLYKEVSEDTIKCLDINELNKAIDMIKESNNIYVFSSGMTLNLARLFQEKMLKINMNVIVYDSLDLQYIKSVNCEQSDCFILLSYTGETTRILQIARNLKLRKAKTISVTSIGNNHLSNLTTCHLYVSSHEKITNNIADFSSILSTNLVLDILYSCVFNLDHRKNLKHRKELTERYEVQRQKDVQSHIK